MKYQPPFGSTNPNEAYVDRNLTSGQQGSRVAAKAVEQPLRELDHLISYAGLTPGDADLQQVRKAIEAIFLIDAPITRTVHGAGADFPNLNAAFAWLSRRRITATGSVTFQLAAGQHVYNGSASSVGISHPDMARVTIAGAVLTGGGFPTAGNLTVTGSSSAARGSDNAANLAMIRARVPTELRFTGGAAFSAQGSISVQDVLFTGDGSVGVDGPVFRLGFASLLRIACYGFGGRGLVVAAGYATLNNVYSFGSGTYNIHADDGGNVGVFGPVFSTGGAGVGIATQVASSLRTAPGGTILSSGNASYGVSSSLGGVVSAGSGSAANNNGASGWFCEGAVMWAQNTSGSNNAGYAYLATAAAMISAQSTTMGGNTIGGYLAERGSTIVAIGGPNGVASPTANTIGNSNSMVIQ
jgi:hypothetical protein